MCGGGGCVGGRGARTAECGGCEQTPDTLRLRPSVITQSQSRRHPEPEPETGSRQMLGDDGITWLLWQHTCQYQAPAWVRDQCQSQGPRDKIEMSPATSRGRVSESGRFVCITPLSIIIQCSLSVWTDMGDPSRGDKLTVKSRSGRVKITTIRDKMRYQVTKLVLNLSLSPV